MYPGIQYSGFGKNKVEKNNGWLNRCSLKFCLHLFCEMINRLLLFPARQATRAGDLLHAHFYLLFFALLIYQVHLIVTLAYFLQRKVMSFLLVKV